MNDGEPNLKALRREWLVARIMAVLGGLLLIATVVTIVMANLSSPPPPATAAMPETPAAPTADTAAAQRQEDIALCDAALATVQGMGLVPAFAVRDGDRSEPGGVQGRYTCHGKTDAAKYTITFDLACTHLGDGKCIVPYAVAQDGVAVLYQRH
ncbi:MAG TPA: hypothetical protein VHZ78_04230 [Rhizomicrobium sp.]|nr:hypothetical protein [Rhizomicrobium sp.]